MDSLIIKELLVATKIGVYEWEQRIVQPLVIDIHIGGDFSRCQDLLENTIDYEALCRRVTQFVEAASFRLIESVANAVAALIKQEFYLEKVTVSVSKPQAIANAKNVQVVVER